MGLYCKACVVRRKLGDGSWECFFGNLLLGWELS